MSEKCKYHLPCGWCDKKDKICELPTNGSIVAPLVDVNALGCDHEWECTSLSTGMAYYICRKCHETKTEVCCL